MLRATRDKLREAVPARQRSKFVSEAIEAALKQTAPEDVQKAALDAIDNAPNYSTDGQDSVEVLRKLRRERAEYITSRHSPNTG